MAQSSGRRLVPTIVVAATMASLAAWKPVTANDADKGLSLLMHAVDARERTRALDLSFSFEFKGAPKLRCRLESSDKLLRCEILAPDEARGVVLVDEKFVWTYAPEQDLCRMSLELAAERGEICYDPRLIGVHMLPRLDAHLRNIMLEGVKNTETTGKVVVDGATCSVVKFARDGVEFEYVIEAATARIYSISVKANGSETTIRSQFGTPKNNETAWLPTEVTVTDKHVPNHFSDISLRGKAQKGRFTLGEMGVPAGTAVVDYVMHRRIGYWDGDKIAAPKASPVDDLFKPWPLHKPWPESSKAERADTPAN